MECSHKAESFLREVVQHACPWWSLPIRVMEVETEKRAPSRGESLVKCIFIRLVVPLEKTTMVRSNCESSLIYILAYLRECTHMWWEPAWSTVWDWGLSPRLWIYHELDLFLGDFLAVDPRMPDFTLFLTNQLTWHQCLHKHLLHLSMPYL